MLMFAPDNGKTKVHIKLHFTPEWNRNSGANWLKLDNYGGLGVFVIGRAYKATEAGGEEFEVSVGPGLTGEVLWVSIVPARSSGKTPLTTTRQTGQSASLNLLICRQRRLPATSVWGPAVSLPLRECINQLFF